MFVYVCIRTKNSAKQKIEGDILRLITLLIHIYLHLVRKMFFMYCSLNIPKETAARLGVLSLISLPKKERTKIKSTRLSLVFCRRKSTFVSVDMSCLCDVHFFVQLYLCISEFVLFYLSLNIHTSKRFVYYYLMIQSILQKRRQEGRKLKILCSFQTNLISNEIFPFLLFMVLLFQNQLTQVFLFKRYDYLEQS